MSETPRYVPILKGKQGELDALRDVQPRTRRGMLPLVEIVPPEDSSDVTAMEKACTTTVGRLAPRYGQPLMLDAGLFDLSIPVSGRRSALGLLAVEARSEGLIAHPVVRLGDPALALKDARQAAAKDGRGIAVRLGGEDVDEEPEDLDSQLDDLLAQVDVAPSEVDLILDLGAVEGDVAVRGGARMLTSLIRDLPSIAEWRSVTIAGGGFPVDLSQVTPNVIGLRPRYDAQLFDQVRKRKLPRVPDYGDYAIAHPVLAAGAMYSPPPQLRYTVAEHWLILKGRRTDPLGNAQFHRICTIIAAHPEFVGAALGKADTRIATGSPEGPGNGSTWRAIGTTHHLDLVTTRLTTLGEP